MSVRLRTLERYSTIREVNRAAVTEPGLTEIFTRMCKAVKRVIPCDRAGLSLYAPDRGVLTLAAAEGCGPGSFYNVGLTLDCEATHHGWVFQHKKPIVRRDLHRELEFQIEEHNVREGIRSYCAVPMIVRGESVGVIIVLSSHKNQYSAGHAEFMQEVADQVVLAIRSLMPFCPKHSHTRLICPRCIASGGGQATAALHKDQLANWGRQGGRGKKKPAGGLMNAILE